jgi:hypothetical protein
MNRPFLIVLPVFLSGVVLVRAPGNPASMAAAPATTASIPATGPAALPAIVTVEPSVDGRRPAALQAPFHIEASGSALRPGESHSYVLDVKTPGVHKFVVTRLPARKDGLGNFYVYIMPPSQKREWYWDASPDEHHFYPVLTPGQHEITVRSSGGDAGDRYRLSLLPDPCEMTESLKADAKAAIDRGVAVLLKAKPAKADYVYQPAMEALVMAALAEGEAKKDRAGIVESDYLAWFEKRLKEDKKGTWAGQTVSHFGTGALYEESIITLGLAQAASSGSAKAKALARTGSTYLLASQLTARRCPAWGAIQRGNIEYGGWRYTGAATNADISVTGWCIVADRKSVV